MYLQMSMQSNTSQALQSRYIFYFDDVLYHATSIDKLITVIAHFFTHRKEYNLKLLPTNRVLYTCRSYWFGSSKAGDLFESRGIDGILNVPVPGTGGELHQKFLRAIMDPKFHSNVHKKIFYPLNSFWRKFTPKPAAARSCQLSSACTAFLLFKMVLVFKQTTSTSSSFSTNTPSFVTYCSRSTTNSCDGLSYSGLTTTPACQIAVF